MKFLAIDFETANNSRASACSVGLARVEGGQIAHKASFLIRPPTTEFLFTYIHGLKWSDVASAKTFGELWPEIEPWFKDIDFVAAHNASFDKSVLSACLAAAKIPAPRLEFKCSMRAAKKAWDFQVLNLAYVCKKLDIQLSHHEALSDALACAQIMIAAKAISPDFFQGPA
jgi:DNA polymerase-3 subunit epsilon